MYNNAGRDAVESSLRSGKVFRIGTDQPTELLDAIDRSDLGVLSSGVRDCDGSDRASRGAPTARLKELAGK